jgi:acetate kinase
MKGEGLPKGEEWKLAPSMNILVINCGSSSIKYRLFAMPERRILAGGLLEKVGTPDAVLHQTAGGRTSSRPCAAPDHGAGLRAIAATAAGKGVEAVGHRVVHGGERFTGSVRVTDAVIEALEACAPLAPLHNPPNLAGIRAAAALFPDAPQVACFDTAFHQTMPEHAYLYALPRRLYAAYGIRRYGFHGTSHRYVAGRAAAMLGRPPAAAGLVTCHLGNGCSVTAVAGGRSVDTSMGLTPLEGLVMGTRCGDIDPAIPFTLAERAGLSFDAVHALLNSESGLLGLSGRSNDMRDILGAAAGGDADAARAVAVFCYRIKKYIGAYAAALGRLDAVVFTGGIGENAAPVRARVCEGLDILGIALDAEANEAARDDERDIAAAGARVRVFVIPTDEEAAIAGDTYTVLEKA